MKSVEYFAPVIDTRIVVFASPIDCMDDVKDDIEM
jgi:hypothetical protein